MSQKKQERATQWRNLIAEQETSNQSIREFCRQRGINEHSFYMWRQRLREQPVRFALVETKTPARATASEPSVQPIEIELTTGDRLRVAPDPATLRLVLNALRENHA